MKTFLEKEGFEVESFESAQEANIAISGGDVDMVITGLAFADMEGEEFLKKVEESFTGPLIVLSATLDKEIEKKLLSLGARAAISKSGLWQESLKPHLSALK